MLWESGRALISGSREQKTSDLVLKSLEQSGASVCWTSWEVVFLNDDKLHCLTCTAVVIVHCWLVTLSHGPILKTTALYHDHTHTISPVEVLTWHLLFVQFWLWVFQKSSAESVCKCAITHEHRYTVERIQRRESLSETTINWCN